MDARWKPVNRDSKREVKVLLHPSAAIWEVRRGFETGSDDAVDLSEFVTQASHSAFEATVMLSFNRELFGAPQPKPHQILEIQLKQSGRWLPVWLGIVDAISSFTLQRGERSMQLIAKTREQQDVWKYVKRQTPLFPLMTNLTYIAQRVARAAGMQGDEIVLPPSAFYTSHSNTQMADMNAWDMILQLFLPMGWFPYIDGLGRLRAADRNLGGRRADIVLEDSRLVKVGGQRQRPPVSRVRVKWRNPLLKKALKQVQLLDTYPVTLGWFIPFMWKTVNFSQDKTQRADATYFKANPSVNTWPFSPFVYEHYTHQTETQGKLWFVNFNTAAIIPMIIKWLQAHNMPDGIDWERSVTFPIGRKQEAIYGGILLYFMANVGSGIYEIWGAPFDYVHAVNISEAFDKSVPIWVDNPEELESDFIANEEHARAVAIRELIYRARAANKWSVTLVDDPRIEYGDLLQFTDGSQLFVEDFTRRLERGSEATLEVSGFLIPVTRPSKTIPLPPGTTTTSGTPSGGGINKPCWLGWFEFDFLTVEELAYVPPANCALWVDVIGPAGLAGPIKHITTDAMVAQWVQGDTVESIETQVHALGVPAVAYWDAREWPRFPVLRQDDWLALQAYCRQEEAPAAFEESMRHVISSVPMGYKVCLVCQCYTSNLSLTDNLAGLVPVYTRLAKDFPSVTMLLVFTDQGRPTGMNDHPEMRTLWQGVFASIPATP